MLKKRELCIFAASVLAIYALMPLGACAASAVNSSTGVLFWDFESEDQIAPPPLKTETNGQGGTVPKYTIGYLQGADGIDSGAWTQIDAGNPNASSIPIIRVGMDKMYKREASQATADNGTDYYPTDIKGTALSDAGKLVDQSEIEGHGSYCAAALSNATSGGGPRVVGMAIKLTDTEVIPGQSYKFACDAYCSKPTSGAGNIVLYAGFGKPSDRKNDADGVYRRWDNGTSSIVPAKSCYFDCYGSNTNAKWIVSLPDETWTNYESSYILQASAANFENHETILYVGVFSNTAYAGYGYLSGGYKLFLDNIKLTPQSNTFYSYAEQGAMFDFETDAGGWTCLKETDNRIITRPTVAEANTELEAEGVLGQIGGFAANSTRCIGIQKNDDDQCSGIKLYLNQQKYPEGTYTLKFKAAQPAEPFIGERLFTAVKPGRWSVENYRDYSAESLAGGAYKLLGPWWQDITYDLTIESTDFVDGYATVILVTDRKYDSWVTGSITPFVQYYFVGDPMTYYDDISIIRKTTSASTAQPDIVAGAALYGGTKNVTYISSAWNGSRFLWGAPTSAQVQGKK